MTYAFALFPKRQHLAVLFLGTFFLIAPSNHVAAAICLQSPGDFSPIPKTIQGVVIGKNEQPIKSFKATLKLVSHNRRSGNDKTVAIWKSQGTDGKFEKQLTPADQARFAQAAQTGKRLGHIEPAFILSISATGHVNSSIRVPAFQFKGQFPTSKLREAVKIVGRFKTKPDAENEPFTTGYVKAIERLGALPSANQYQQRFAQTVALNKDGSFEFWAPKSSKLFLTAQTESSTPWTHQVAVNPSLGKTVENPPVVDIGSHKLASGVSVRGIVVDRDNSPVAQQVVQLYQLRNDIQFTDTSTRSYALTNSLGQFSFPPFIGKVEVSLVDEGTSIAGQRIVTANKTLAATPIELNLDLSSSTNFLEIKEANHHTVHATVKVPDNISTLQIAIKLWRSQDKSNARWLSIESDGTFNFELIKGTSYCISFRDELNNRQCKVFIEESTNQGHAFQFSDLPSQPKRTFKIKPLDNNIGPIRFKILEGQ